MHSIGNQVVILSVLLPLRTYYHHYFNTAHHYGKYIGYILEVSYRRYVFSCTVTSLHAQYVIRNTVEISLLKFST